jgi:hypothetical protein
MMHKDIEEHLEKSGLAWTHLRPTGFMQEYLREAPSIWEGRTARRLRKKVEMLFAHLKRILKLDRLRLRGPNGARDEFLLAATAQNLRKLAKLIPMPSPHPARDH